jgi:integrase/recombinase XerD
MCTTTVQLAQAPQAPAALIEAFCEALWHEGLARTTSAGYALNLQVLARFCAARQVALHEARQYDLEAFLGMLMTSRRVGAHAARRYMAAFRKFYAWLVLTGQRTDDPTAHIALPKLAAHVPKAMPQSATERLLQARVARNDAEALRDRAMVELAYGAGLRVSELVGLRLNRLDLDAGCATVCGKGNRERQVPLGEPAVQALKDYLEHGRARYLRACKDRRSAAGFVFLTRQGRPMTRQFFWQRIKALARAAGLNAARVSPHVLRHSYATDLLNGGADLRTLQLLLGHESVATTVVYTKVGRPELKEIHRRHHPRG